MMAIHCIFFVLCHHMVAKIQSILALNSCRMVQSWIEGAPILVWIEDAPILVYKYPRRRIVYSVEMEDHVR